MRCMICNNFYRLITNTEEYTQKMNSASDIVSIDELSTDAILAGNSAILQIRKTIDNINKQSYNAKTLLKIGVLLTEIVDNVKSMNEHFAGNT